MKTAAFLSLLALPLLSLARPAPVKRQISVTDLVSNVEGLVNQVTTLTANINGSVAVPLTNQDATLAVVEVNLHAIVTAVEGVVATTGVVTLADGVVGDVETLVAGLVGTVLTTVAGTLGVVTGSALDLTTTVTEEIATLTNVLGSLVAVLSALGLGTIIPTVTSIAGDVPLVGEVVSIAGGLSASVGGSVLGGVAMY